MERGPLSHGWPNPPCTLPRIKALIGRRFAPAIRPRVTAATQATWVVLAAAGPAGSSRPSTPWKGRFGCGISEREAQVAWIVFEDEAGQLMTPRGLGLEDGACPQSGESPSVRDGVVLLQPRASSKLILPEKASLSVLGLSQSPSHLRISSWSYDLRRVGVIPRPERERLSGGHLRPFRAIRGVQVGKRWGKIRAARTCWTRSVANKSHLP